jgi:HK97 family phage major capsid protein
MRKALSVGIEADGGYWVTPEMSSRVLTRIFETSPIRTIASVMTIGTDAVEFPNDLNSAVSGGWVGEKQSRDETDTPQVGTQRIPVHEQYAMPKATQKLLDDATFAVESWLANKIADIMIRTENAAFVSGNGEAKPKGFLDYASASVTTDDATRAWGILQYVPSGGAADFHATLPGDALIDIVHKIQPQFRAGAVWLMNRATTAGVRKMKDGQDNYLWSAGDIQRGNPQSLFGHPIVMAEDMPDVGANTFPIVFGDFRAGYQIVDRQGIRTLRDPFTDKPFVLFYTTRRVGADVLNFDAIKLFKIATT